MKTYLKITTLSCLFIVFSFFGYQVFAKINSKNKEHKELQILPEFSFETLTKKEYTNKHLKDNQTTIIIYFNSGCDFCQNEARIIKKHINQFRDVQFLFVSHEPIEDIQNFAKQYQLDHYDNITFLFDKRDHFTHRFGATSVPYLLIYNKNKELIKRHKGQLTISGLIKAIN